MKNKIDFRPKGNGVMIHLESKTESGIIMPEGSSEQMVEDRYEIVAVGNKCEDTKVGDVVAFVNHANPTLMILDGEKYMCLKEHDILGYFDTKLKLVA